MQTELGKLDNLISKLLNNVDLLEITIRKDDAKNVLFGELEILYFRKIVTSPLLKSMFM